MRFVVDRDEGEADDALATVADWLASPNARFVLILGDFGTGKTFLLHQLAMRMAADSAPLLPILIEMRALEKGRTLDQLVAQHHAGAGEQRIDLRAFRYMLAQGRIALLFDGFDELALRVTFENAAEHFGTLVEAAGGSAKIAVTSRTQHFDRWLGHEFDRTHPRGSEVILPREQRWDAVTNLAMRLWQKTERAVKVSELTEEVANAVEKLSENPADWKVAAHMIGSGTLLVRDEEGGFSFVHQSVMEWLVASKAFKELERGSPAEVLIVRELSPLMADFLCDLAGIDKVGERRRG